jgi:hypothetical protein
MVKGTASAQRDHWLSPNERKLCGTHVGSVNYWYRPAEYIKNYATLLHQMFNSENNPFLIINILAQNDENSARCYDRHISDKVWTWIRCSRVLRQSLRLIARRISSWRKTKSFTSNFAKQEENWNKILPSILPLL